MPAVRLSRLLRAACAGLWLSLSAPGVRAVPAADEAAVKAALLYNLTQFVDWPPSSFRTPYDPVIIGILGPDPFDDYLDQLVRPVGAGSRRVVVMRFRDARAARQAHVLFIHASQREHLQAIFATLEGRAVLTVADFDGFLRRGGIVRFYRNAENKIRVRINLEAARAAGLTISAKLLRVVEIVPPEEE
ncbi:YfiR family protein [Opitutus terrae]|nr:YfiR family protein [Opitutus terrae]